jgi:hypothetical protein
MANAATLTSSGMRLLGNKPVNASRSGAGNDVSAAAGDPRSEGDPAV